jgi:hypothetical protein
MHSRSCAQSHPTNPGRTFLERGPAPALPSIDNVSEYRFREPDDELPQPIVLAFETGERLFQLCVLEAIGPLHLAKVRFHVSPFKSQHPFPTRKNDRSKFGNCTYKIPRSYVSILIYERRALLNRGFEWWSVILGATRNYYLAPSGVADRQIREEPH